LDGPEFSQGCRRQDLEQGREEPFHYFAIFSESDYRKVLEFPLFCFLKMIKLFIKIFCEQVREDFIGMAGAFGQFLQYSFSLRVL